MTGVTQRRTVRIYRHICFRTIGTAPDRDSLIAVRILTERQFEKRNLEKLLIQLGSTWKK